jgi:hypothetical protein
VVKVTTKRVATRRAKRKVTRKAAKEKPLYNVFSAYNSLLASDRCKIKMEHFNSSTV